MGRLRIDDFPSRLPPRYVERTLARLLPSPSDIANFNHSQLHRLWIVKEELRQKILTNPARYFIPNVGGQEEYLRFDEPGVRGRFFFAGNKTGKTTATCIRVAEHMLGRALWGGAGRGSGGLAVGGNVAASGGAATAGAARGAANGASGGMAANATRPLGPRFSHGVPCRGVYYTEDFASHEETIIPTYLTWMPKGEIPYGGLIRNQAGYVSQIIHKNGSVLYFRTYDQGYEKAEGKDYHVEAFDEPPPRDTYTACFRGLVALDGVMYIGATLLKEPWLYDELEHTFVKGFSSSTYDNKWLSAEALADFDSMLDENERLVRIHGKPLTLTGHIYPEFRDAAPIVVDLSTYGSARGGLGGVVGANLVGGVGGLPYDPQCEKPYPIGMGVDPHERKPLHIAYFWLLPDDTILWFDWILIENTSLDDIRDTLARKDAQHGARPVICVIDPNRGKAKQIDGECWADKFEQWGYAIELGNDDLSFGHSKTRQLIKSGQMRWTVECRGAKQGPIFQMSRYTWDDWAKSRGNDKRTVKEKPQERYKDFPDVHRYVAMANLSFDMLNHMDTVIDMRDNALHMTRPSGMRPRAYI